MLGCNIATGQQIIHKEAAFTADFAGPAESPDALATIYKVVVHRTIGDYYLVFPYPPEQVFPE